MNADDLREVVKYFRAEGRDPYVRGGSHGAVTLENSLPSELPLSRRLLALPRED